MGERGQCVGFQSLTVSATAQGLTLPTNGDSVVANAALIRVDTANARYRMDGTAPTASVGMPLLSTDTQAFWIVGQGNLVNFKIIAQTGSPVLSVMYFGSAPN